MLLLLLLWLFSPYCKSQSLDCYCGLFVGLFVYLNGLMSFLLGISLKFWNFQQQLFIFFFSSLISVFYFFRKKKPGEKNPNPINQFANQTCCSIFLWFCHKVSTRDLVNIYVYKHTHLMIAIDGVINPKMRKQMKWHNVNKYRAAVFFPALPQRFECDHWPFFFGQKISYSTSGTDHWIIFFFSSHSFFSHLYHSKFFCTFFSG